ncbi:hypothetical protein [Leifsonia kafniensis]
MNTVRVAHNELGGLDIGVAVVSHDHLHIAALILWRKMPVKSHFVTTRMP